MTHDPVTITEAERDALDWYETPSSSNVRRVAFQRARTDEDGTERGTLHVEFRGGSHYQYEDATFEEGRALVRADIEDGASVGRTLNEHVKPRRACRKVTVTAEPDEAAS